MRVCICTSVAASATLSDGALEALQQRTGAEVVTLRNSYENKENEALDDETLKKADVIVLDLVGDARVATEALARIKRLRLEAEEALRMWNAEEHEKKEEILVGTNAEDKEEMVETTEKTEKTEKTQENEAIAEAETNVAQVVCAAPYPATQLLLAVSTVLSWAQTPATDTDGFSEKNYIGRRPAKRFAAVKQAEDEALKVQLETLKAKVVCLGVPYGGKSPVFQPYLSAAWRSASGPIIGSGNNRIPTVHAHDAAQTLIALSEAHIAASQAINDAPAYMIVCDAAHDTQGSIAQALSTALGTGATHIINETDDDVLLDAYGQPELLTGDLVFAPGFASNLPVSWVSQAGIVANAAQIASEYVSAAGLKPLRALVYGPPFSGRSELAKATAAAYGIPCVGIKELIDQGLSQADEWSSQARAALEAAAAAAAKAKKKPVKGAPEPKPRLPHDLVAVLLQQRLSQPDCKKKGYVLDGYPGDADEYKQAFAGNESRINTFIVVKGSQQSSSERRQQVPPASTVADFSDDAGFARRWARFEAVQASASSVSSLLPWSGEPEAAIIEVTSDVAAAVHTIQHSLNDASKHVSNNAGEEQILEQTPGEDIAAKVYDAPNEDDAVAPTNSVSPSSYTYSAADLEKHVQALRRFAAKSFGQDIGTAAVKAAEEGRPHSDIISELGAQIVFPSEL